MKFIKEITIVWILLIIGLSTAADETENDLKKEEFEITAIPPVVTFKKDDTSDRTC